MDETNFPPWCHSDDIQDTVYQESAVNEWFKRCIEDYPGTWKPTAYDGYPSSIPIARHKIQEWFDKWFSQFKLKGEENVD